MLSHPLLRSPFVIITIAGLTISLPYFIWGIPWPMDREWILTAYYGFSHQFRNGELYPRWIPTLFNGFGAPFFFFYPPFAYFLTTVVSSLCPIPLSLEHEMGIGYTVMLILSGLTAYLWLRNNASSRTAVIGAIFYMILPYHFFFDIYSRGAPAEICVYIALPLTFLYVEKNSENVPRSLLAFALSYALLIPSHIPTAVYTSGFLLAYALILGFREESSGARIALFVRICGGMALGAALVALYMLPALTLLGYISTNTLWGPHFQYWNWFLCLRDCYDPMGVRMTLVALSQCLLVLGLAPLIARRSQDSKKLKNIFWVLVPVAILFLMSSASAFIWKIAIPLQKIQFPWRMLTLMDIALSYVFVRVFDDVAAIIRRRDIKETAAILLAALWLVLGFGSVISGTIKDTAADSFEPRPTMIARGYSQPSEYIAGGSSLSNDDLMHMDNVPWVEFKSGRGAATMETVGPRRKLIHVKAESPSTLQLRTFYFAGWVAHDQKTGQVFPLTASTPWRTIVIEVPAGERTVVLELKTLWQENVGAAISAAALFSICAYLLATARRQPKHA